MQTLIKTLYTVWNLPRLLFLHKKHIIPYTIQNTLYNIDSTKSCSLTAVVLLLLSNISLLSSVQTSRCVYQQQPPRRSAALTFSLSLSLLFSHSLFVCRTPTVILTRLLSIGFVFVAHCRWRLLLLLAFWAWPWPLPMLSSVTFSTVGYLYSGLSICGAVRALRTGTVWP